MSEEKSRALVLRFYEELDRGNLDEFDELVSPDFVAHLLGTMTLDWIGFKQMAGAFRSAIPDGRHVFDHVVADGGNVVTVGMFQGTHLGEFQGLPPTRSSYQVSVMHLDRVVNGKIVAHHGLANELDIMRQLGVEMVPKPDASESPT